MWLFTKDGFYSIVQDEWCDDDELVVRGRIKEDLFKLKEAIAAMRFVDEIGGEIYVPRGPVVTPEADYAFRLYVNRSVLARFMQKEIENLNYCNFKSLIPDKDRKRKEVYHDVWVTLFRWQRWHRRLLEKHLKRLFT